MQRFDLIYHGLVELPVRLVVLLWPLAPGSGVLPTLQDISQEGHLAVRITTPDSSGVLYIPDELPGTVKAGDLSATCRWVMLTRTTGANPDRSFVHSLR